MFSSIHFSKMLNNGGRFLREFFEKCLIMGANSSQSSSRIFQIHYWIHFTEFHLKSFSRGSDIKSKHKVEEKPKEKPKYDPIKCAVYFNKEQNL